MKDIKASHDRAVKGFAELFQQINNMKFHLKREEESIKGLRSAGELIVVSSERVVIEESIRGLKKRKQLVEETVLPEFNEVSKQHEIYMKHWNEIETELDRYGETEEDSKNFDGHWKEFELVASSGATASRKLSATIEQGMKEMGKILGVSTKRLLDELTKKTERNLIRGLIILLVLAIFGAMWYIFTEAEGEGETKLFRTISTLSSFTIGMFTSLFVAWLFYSLNWEQRRISKELLRQQYEGDFFKNISRWQELVAEVFPQNRSTWWLMVRHFWRALRLMLGSKEMVRVKEIFRREGF